MRTRVKICGITNVEDARTAIEAGADALGFVMSESKRKVTAEQAEAIVSELPPLVSCVGVFVDEKPSFVSNVVRSVGFDAIQLQGSETSSEFSSCNCDVIKSFKVGSNFHLNTVRTDGCQAILFDSQVANQHGGTGICFDWSKISSNNLELPIYLAGGLNPKNVGEAISQIRPFAVDVSSGVERRPGLKNATLMHAFMTTVREADNQLCKDLENA